MNLDSFMALSLFMLGMAWLGSFVSAFTSSESVSEYQHISFSISCSAGSVPAWRRFPLALNYLTNTLQHGARRCRQGNKPCCIYTNGWNLLSSSAVQLQLQWHIYSDSDMTWLGPWHDKSFERVSQPNQIKSESKSKYLESELTHWSHLI